MCGGSLGEFFGASVGVLVITFGVTFNCPASRGAGVHLRHNVPVLVRVLPLYSMVHNLVNVQSRTWTAFPYLRLRVWGLGVRFFARARLCMARASIRWEFSLSRTCNSQEKRLPDAEMIIAHKK